MPFPTLRTTTLLGFVLPFLACSSGPEAYRRQAIEAAQAVLDEAANSPYDRLVAAGVLYGAGSPDGEQYLERALLGGGNFEQRAAVAAVLTERDSRAVRWLAELAARDPVLELEVVQALRSYPRSDAGEIVRAGLRAEDFRTRLAALDAAAASRDASLLGEVERTLEGPGDSRMQAFGTYAITVLGGPGARGRLEPMVASEFPDDREIAAASLGYIDTAWSREALQALTQDLNPRVQIAVAASRARLGEPDGVGALIQFLRGGNSQAATVAAGALRRVHGPGIVTVAQAAFADDRVPVEAAAGVIEALGWTQEAAAEALLIRALQHQDELMQLQGLWAIGWRGREAEIPLAAQQLGSQNVAVRAMAAWAVIFASDGGHQL